MAEPTLVFTINVLPPPKPRGSVWVAEGDAEHRSMRLDFKPDDTIEQVWRQIQQEWDNNYSESEREGACFARLQDAGGADMPRHKTVNDLFRGMPFSDRVINVKQVAIDKESSLAPGTHLQPEGYKRRRVEDLTPDRQEAFKRRRLEEGRYGSTLSGLSADTPVTSRESAHGRVRGEEDGEHRLDSDGFKIPRMIRQAQQRQATQPQSSSQEMILVEDSQPKTTSDPPQSAAAALRQRRINPSEQQVRVRRQAESSPAQRAPVRVNTAPRAASIPTPDSFRRPGSSSDPPTSGQRPRSSGQPVSETSRRFVSRRAVLGVQPDLDLDVEDPIEDPIEHPRRRNVYSPSDDDDDDDVNVGMISISRGRIRSRSPSLLPPSLDAGIQSSSQILTDDVDVDIASDPGAAADEPQTSSAFDVMNSSQNQSSIKIGKWTEAEDKQLVRGLRTGYQGSELQKNFVPNRSESGIRNRKRKLLLEHPNLLTEDQDAGNGSENSATAPRPSQRTPWQPHHEDTLRKAFVQGYDVLEIVTKFFPQRSADGVRKKIKNLANSAIKTEKDKPNFPRSNIVADKWTDEHNLKLRRHLLKKENSDSHAYKLWFSNVDKNLFLKKLAEYKKQMSDLETGKDTGEAVDRTMETLSQNQTESLVDGFSEGPSTQQTGEVSLGATEPHNEQNSSPADLPDTTPRAASPDVVVTELEQITATQPENNVSVFNEDGIVPEPETATRQASAGGNGAQTTLGQYFQRDKGKAPYRPARPSTSELDAQFGRGSSRATANSQHQAGLQAEPSDQQQISSVNSDRESISDAHEAGSKIGKDGDELSRESSSEPDSKTLARDAEAQLLAEFNQDAPIELVASADQINVPNTPSHPPAQLDGDASHAPSQPLEDHSQPPASNATSLVIGETQLTDPRGSNNVSSFPGVVSEFQPSAEPMTRGQPGRLPRRNLASSRSQHIATSQVGDMHSLADSTTQSLSQPIAGRSGGSTMQSPSQPAAVRSSSRTPQSVSTAEGRRGSTIQSQSQTPARGRRSSITQSQSLSRAQGSRGSTAPSQPQMPAQRRRDSTTQSQSQSPAPRRTAQSQSQSQAVSRRGNDGATTLQSTARSRRDSSTQSQPQSPAQPRNASFLGPQSEALVRLPQGQLSRSDLRQSQVDSPRRPRILLEANGEPFVPFEKRPMTADGMIDAGRPGFPYYIKHNHSWVSSQDAMWVEAVQKAKPEWVEDMYNYIRDNSILLLRLAAGDDEGRATAHKRILRARVERRKKMGLPPLHTLRGPRYEYLVPGGEEVSASEDDVDSDFEPDSEDDDGLDYTMMKAEVPRTEVDDGDDVSSIEAIRDREIVELRDGEDEDEAEVAKILDINFGLIESRDEEDLGLADQRTADPVDNNYESNDTKLQRPMRDVGVDVYDDACGFIETRSFSLYSGSPTVQPTSPPSENTDRGSLVAQGFDGTDERQSVENSAPLSDRQIARPARSARPTDHVSSLRISNENPHATQNAQVGIAGGISTPSSPVAPVSEVQPLAEKQKKKRKRSKDVAAGAVSEGFSDQLKADERMAEASQNNPDKNSKYLDGDDGNHGKRKRKRARKSKGQEDQKGAATNAQAESSSPKKREDDRVAMPPPSHARPSRQPPRLQRLESISSDITDTSNSSRYGARNDGARTSRRAHRRQEGNASRQSETGSVADDRIHSEGVRGPAQPMQSDGTSKKVFYSEQAAPPARNVREWVNGQSFSAIDERPTLTSGAGREVQASVAPTTPVTRQGRRSGLFTQNSRSPMNIPAPPRQREPLLAQPNQMPYGSDDEDGESEKDSSD